MYANRILRLEPINDIALKLSDLGSPGFIRCAVYIQLKMKEVLLQRVVFKKSWGSVRNCDCLK